MKSSKRPKLLSLIFSLFPIYKYKITGQSMFPAIKNGEYVLINRLAYLFKSPKKNDIVSLHDTRDGKTLIKRITKIYNNKYFVTGDNQEYSTDSREFGMIDRNSIIGKIINNK